MNEAGTLGGGVDAGFSLTEQGASSVAQGTDALFVAMLVVCGLMALLLCVLIIWFCVRFRAGSAADRTDPPSHANGLEAGWTVFPLAIFLGMFGWAAYGNVQLHRVPADALPVYVVGKQWMWKLQHANGRQEINELHVPIDQPVVLVMASQDVIHSFYVPAFRIKQDVLPGRYTRLWFTATRLGDWRILCSEYCGASHSEMIGHVVVMRQADYARWVETQPSEAVPTEATSSDDPLPTPQQLGAALYRRLACGSCHDAGSSVHASALAGLYGSRVALADGSALVADDNYLREAIVAPKARVVAGQPNIMPSYADQLDEEQIQALVAYLRSLAPAGHAGTLKGGT
jgi:cytochrome c oxidase subunit 2